VQAAVGDGGRRCGRLRFGRHFHRRDSMTLIAANNAT
jgi:hypothetical protein